MHDSSFRYVVLYNVTEEEGLNCLVVPLCLWDSLDREAKDLEGPFWTRYRALTYTTCTGTQFWMFAFSRAFQTNFQMVQNSV